MKTYKSTIDSIRLVRETSEIQKVQIKNSKDVYNYIKPVYADSLTIYESMYLLLLNRKNNTTGYVKISQGGTAGTVTDIKLIAKYAIESLCNSIILIHNHPSGYPDPSDSDKEITRKVNEAMKLFDIHLLDNLIICDNDKFFSFMDEGILI